MATNDPTGLYSGVRPSDLRFENWHVLAEYIAQAQRLVDSSAKTQQESERLLNEATTTAQRGVREFRAAGQHLTAQSSRLGSTLHAAILKEAGRLAQGVADVQTAGATLILQASEIANARSKELAERAEHVNRAAERLERAADLAATERRTMEAELAGLKAYKAEVVKFEGETMTCVAEEKAQLYRGASLWRRLVFVFLPPTPKLREPKVPTRPAALSRPTKLATHR